MKADYIVTVHIKGHKSLSSKNMKRRIESHLQYWLYGEVDFFNVVRVIRKVPQKTI